MKTNEVAGRFIADIYRTAAVGGENPSPSKGERDSMKRYVEREYISRLLSRSEEANERLREVTFGFLRGKESDSVFKRAVIEHCFIWNIREYGVPAAVGQPGAPGHEQPHSPLMVLVEGDMKAEPCTWEDFAETNKDAFATAELSKIKQELLAGRPVRFGGGAAPLVTVTRVLPVEQAGAATNSAPLPALQATRRRRTA